MSDSRVFSSPRPLDVPLLSLVIPCYNEQRNLPGLVEKCARLVEGRAVEVVLVDNGSTDDTPTLLPELLSANDRLRTIRVEVNQGYGFGILSGLRAARGSYLGWTHADLQTDPLDVLPALQYIEAEGCPGDLYLKGSRYGRGLFDVGFTVGMTLFERIVLGNWLWDINAQPNIFHRTFFEGLQNPPHDFSLDLYVFHAATRQGLHIKRFPVRFGKRGYGVGHNETLRAKLRYSWRTIKFSAGLRKRLLAQGHN
ncbi:MAG: hypothetical protein A2W25_01305 [candidate division Zixibacteria bacterium RBG_16_53_22]|nr:MAG: hypothetical protein A2W25_01305 [candidate division Zixibacteria bacterium RBG_16_53_22]